MRYIRPREFRHNPRQPIGALDAVVQTFERARFTFDETAALGGAWQAGEDIRLREDPRFWELDQLGQFHLSHHRLANDLLATRLWQGVWDGRELEGELATLDAANQGQFHVFCRHDPRFADKNGQLFLTARPRVELPSNMQTALDAAAQPLLQQHRNLETPFTTLQLREHLDALGAALPDVEDVLDTIEGWLRQRTEWTEVARSLWLPTDLVPALDPPKPFRVLHVRGRDAESMDVEVIEIWDEPSASHEPQRVVTLPDPPVARHPDSSVTWTHVLRAIHIHGTYLPVPVAARFRYPRFVGAAGNVVLRCVDHDSGREGAMWLDRQGNRFFGELLREMIEWAEAGRKLHLHWRPEAVVIRTGEIDHAVHEEERRHLDPVALHELRFGKGESYRQALVAILRSHPSGLDFRSLSGELASRQGHQPSRATIRTVLYQSPGFFLKSGCWHSRHVSDSSRIFRRRLILGAVGATKDGPLDLAKVATSISAAVQELVPSRKTSRLAGPTKVDDPVAAKGAITSVTFIPSKRGKGPPAGAVPVYPLQIAAGPFSEGAEAPEPEAWVKVGRKRDTSGYFAAYVKGRSMEPVIPDGALCLFHRQIGGVAGSRQGRIVLARHRMIDDPDAGGSFTVKRYKRLTPLTDAQSREGGVIHLMPENPDCEPIVIHSTEDDPVTLVAEFVAVLDPTGS